MKDENTSNTSIDKLAIDVSTLVMPSISLDVSDSIMNTYVTLRAAETVQNQYDAILVNAKDKEGWFHYVHSRVEPADELRLNFLNDIVVSGHCYVSKESQLITSRSPTGQTTVRFVEQEKQSLSEFLGTKRLIQCDKPALPIAGPGHLIWGHWLIDFLPRLGVAQSILGRSLKKFIIPIPSDTPNWVFELVNFFCGIGKDRFLLFDRGTEAVFCREGAIPSFVHSEGLHSFILEFYRPYVRDSPIGYPKKICVSRKAMGPTQSVRRIFAQQDYFENVARVHGFSIVYPESLSFRQQVDLFSGADIVAGEYGSGLHSTIFSNPGAIIGQFCMPNSYQSRIAACCGHRSVFLFPDQEATDEVGIRHYEVAENQIDNFFDAMDRI
ncbi:hypothetical protein GCM10010909_24990 [Acidocella aquatica]|uniref:Glycosyltransferase 61 catalytic domain-containing protein n=1 Tax=Acidocella aquatica TaxID=1922313 RepID=A0ABQ6AC76_9PROT|nr:glycosyltransferase family 61 protein [Acidocella aquatica]GLR67818.1 hypothetical protein GCM10010909_24990 [Acidocella aquatica]